MIAGRQVDIDTGSDTVGVPEYLCQDDGYIAGQFSRLAYEEEKRFSPSSRYRMDIGTDYSNRYRNRYSNIFPWDHNRVKLPSDSNDYINASYISLDMDPRVDAKTFIACQGPTSNTVGDFWQMIWAQAEEYNSPVVIVMLTSVAEGFKEKCAQYWPANNREIKQFSFRSLASSHDLEVSFKSSYNDLETQCCITTILMKSTDHRTGDISVRECYHLYYTKWSDFAKPSASSSVLPIIKKADSLNTSKSPLVVHCSAGIGRTGTYIAIDYLLSLFDRGIFTFSEDGDEDRDLVYEAVNIQRKQRLGMVQTQDQYKYIYAVLRQVFLDKKSKN